MSEYGIKILAVGSGPLLAEPEWVEAFDLEAGEAASWVRGLLSTTRDLGKAMRFPDAGAALAYLRQQSETRPLRADGQPNRPLLAFTTAIEPLPAAEP